VPERKARKLGTVPKVVESFLGDYFEGKSGAYKGLRDRSGDKMPPLTSAGFWGGVIGGVSVLAVSLSLTALWSSNAWWFFVTTLCAYPIAEALTPIYDRAASRTKKQRWIPIKYVAFAESILFGAVIGESANSQIKVGLFNSGLSVAVYVFWGLNILVPALLYVDFILRSRFRGV
jgi:hypothetical protein